MRAYIAGPMRGYPKWNFPAFDDATRMLRSQGWEIINPAELDRDIGFDEDSDRLPDGFIENAMRRDIEALLRVDAIVLLPGWEGSSGTAIELTVAKALGLRVFHYQRGYVTSQNPGGSVLAEAERLVLGNRGEDYGHPADDFARTGRMWGAILGVPDVPPELVGLCMCAVKISREVNRPKRDNRVDLAGYAATVDMVQQRKEAA